MKKIAFGILAIAFLAGFLFGSLGCPAMCANGGTLTMDVNQFVQDCEAEGGEAGCEFRLDSACCICDLS